MSTAPFKRVQVHNSEMIGTIFLGVVATILAVATVALVRRYMLVVQERDILKKYVTDHPNSPADISNAEQS